MLKSVVFFVSVFLSGSLFSQDGAPQRSADKDKTVSFYFSGASSKLQNDNFTNDPNLVIHYPVGMNGGLSFTKYFTNHIGLTLGLEFSNYKNQYRCAQYNKSTTTQNDPNGSAYYTITQADYTMQRSVNMVEIPICLRLETSSSDKARLFADIGVKLCSAVSSQMTSSGSITTMGIYPDPNYSNAGYLVWNQQVTGWQTTAVTASNDYSCKNISTAFYCNAGFFVPINKQFQLTCSVFYLKGLGDINESEKGQAYVNYLGEAKSYLPTTISSFGARLGLVVPFGSK
jgi:hypothetical protein